MYRYSMGIVTKGKRYTSVDIIADNDRDMKMIGGALFKQGAEIMVYKRRKLPEGVYRMVKIEDVKPRRKK